MDWKVEIRNNVLKALKDLPEEINFSFQTLLKEIEVSGPVRGNWPNYSKIKGKKDLHHCHLKKGKPTYVAIWKVTDKKIKIVEVYYVGTHEKARY